MTQPMDIDQSLAAIFAQDLNLIVPSPDTDLLTGGLLDSVSFVELVLLLETRFSLSIPLEELDFDNLRSLRRIAQFVEGRLRMTLPGTVS